MTIPRNRTFIIQAHNCLIKNASTTNSASFSLNTRTLSFLKDVCRPSSKIVIVDNTPDLFLMITSKTIIEQRLYNLKQTLAEKLNLFIGDIYTLMADNITSYNYLPCPGMIDQALEELEGSMITGLYSTEAMKKALDRRGVESISIKEIETTYTDVEVYPHKLQSIMNSSGKTKDRETIQDLQNYLELEKQAIQGDNFIMFGQQ